MPIMTTPLPVTVQLSRSLTFKFRVLFTRYISAVECKETKAQERLNWLLFVPSAPDWRKWLTLCWGPDEADIGSASAKLWETWASVWEVLPSSPAWGSEPRLLYLPSPSWLYFQMLLFLPGPGYNPPPFLERRQVCFLLPRTTAFWLAYWSPRFPEGTSWTITGSHLPWISAIPVLSIEIKWIWCLFVPNHSKG